MSRRRGILQAAHDVVVPMAYRLMRPERREQQQEHQRVREKRRA